MCGRINQPDSAIEYGKQLYPEHPELFRQLGAGPRHNVPPGTEPITLHQLTGEPAATRLFWGYRPHWFDKAPVINARLDTILKKSPFWRATLKHRVIVPVAGWFEWTGEKGDKQPWFIHARDGQTIFLAGVSAGKVDAEPGPESGFAIVTDDSAGGMVDIHDRRPEGGGPASAGTVSADDDQAGADLGREGGGSVFSFTIPAVPAPALVDPATGEVRRVGTPVA